MNTQQVNCEVTAPAKATLGFSPEGKLQFTCVQSNQIVKITSGQRVRMTNIPRSYERANGITDGVEGIFIEGAKLPENLSAESPIVYCIGTVVDLFQLASMIVNAPRLEVTILDSIGNDHLDALITELSGLAYTR